MTCEVLPVLWTSGEFREFALHGIQRSPTHRHHIWGGTRRINRKANLIRVCPTVHRFIHAMPREGRLSCLVSKLRQGALDIASLDSCCGFSTIAWLERQEFDSPQWRMWQREVLSWRG